MEGGYHSILGSPSHHEEYGEYFDDSSSLITLWSKGMYLHESIDSLKTRRVPRSSRPIIHRFSNSEGLGHEYLQQKASWCSL